MDLTLTTNSIQFKSRKVLTIFETLLKQNVKEKRKKGLFNDDAAAFSICLRIIQRIWKQGKAYLDNGSKIDLSNNKTQRVGRKQIEIDPSLISAIPLRKRTNIQSLSKVANMAKSTIHRRIKEGHIKPHSNALKPMLTNDKKKARLRFCLSMIEGNEHSSNNPVFNDMFRYVHIDEKLIYMTKESHKYYLFPEEETPYRTCKSKRFITKIMFLATVARPRFDSSDADVFSRKIGIFPFIFKDPAKRNSKKFLDGTLEIKPFLLVTKDVIRDSLINKVLPAIRQKWAACDTRNTIYIKQDNAKPHIDPNDFEFMEAASRDRFDIRLSFQPPNSPDFNVLDLGVFRAIQSLQHQGAPNTIDELVHGVEKAFEDLSFGNLNFVFLTLQMCMIEAMKVYGGNNYKLPQMGKK